MKACTYRRPSSTRQAWPYASRRTTPLFFALTLLGWTTACQPDRADRQARGNDKGPAAHAPQVIVATATRRDVPLYLTALGTVAAWQTVTVRPLVEGRLSEVCFTEGQAVRKGALLARLDPRPFRIAVANAEGALARDRATLDNARVNLQRNQGLQAQALVSLQTVTDQAASVAQAQGALQVDQAALDLARYQLEQTDIVSPIDGVLGVRQLDAGNLSRLSDGNGLVVVTQIDPAAVTLTLPEHVRQAVDAQVQAGGVPVTFYARDDAPPLATGEIRTIDNQMAQGSGTVRLKACAHNPNRALWPGQFVKARLRLQVVHDALAVPASAVQRGNEGEYVYVVGKDDVVQQRAVTRLVLAEGATTEAGPQAAEFERAESERQGGGADGNHTPGRNDRNNGSGGGISISTSSSSSSNNGTSRDHGPPSVPDEPAFVLLADGVAPGEVVVTDGQLRLRPGLKVKVAQDGGADGAKHAEAADGARSAGGSGGANGSASGVPP